MNRLKGIIKGVIFDYGGTIDTNSRHWAEVLWNGYEEYLVPVSKKDFRDAYVYGERTLACRPLVKPEDDFRRVLQLKVGLQTDYLVQQGKLDGNDPRTRLNAGLVADWCYDYVVKVLQRTRPVVREVAARYPTVLVSNFYGNIETILKDFDLDSYFSHVVESSVVGVRKPDPAIYRLGVEAIGLPAGEVLVVGDSFSKDIVPAKAIGCKAAWLKGEGWGNEVTDDSLPDLVITDLPDLLKYI